jgi:hypothetical protein
LAFAKFACIRANRLLFAYRRITARKKHRTEGWMEDRTEGRIGERKDKWINKEIDG